MTNVKPIIDPGTHYRIELKGQVDVDWLQSFDGLAAISVDDTSQLQNVTALDVYTDQSGIVGLVRKLHALGMTILQMEIISDRGKAAEVAQRGQ